MTPDGHSMVNLHRPARARTQHGAAALVLAALMVVFCATLAGTLYLGSRTAASATSYDQTESLRWAQEAVTGFAVAHGRLPCAADVRDGAESCAPGSGKGWLPVATIEQFARPASALGRMTVRYLVYRGTGGGADPDLAVAEDAFQPTLADGSVPFAYPGVVSSVDLCGKLRAASMPPAAGRWTAGDGPSGASARTDRANVPRPSGAGIMNIAYGLAVSPVGTANAQSGRNADTDPHLESPYRSVDATYRDMARSVDFAALFEKLACATTTASLDTLAVAASWTGDAVGMRLGTIEGSDTIVGIERIVVAASGIGVVSVGLDLQNALKSAALATTLVATNLPLQPAPPAVIAVASGTAGQVTAAATIVQAKLELARSILGTSVESMNLVTYEIAKKKGQDSHVWNGSAAVLGAADTLGIAP